MSYSHVGNHQRKRAFMLYALHGRVRRQLNLFTNSLVVLQSGCCEQDYKRSGKFMFVYLNNQIMNISESQPPITAPIMAPLAPLLLKDPPANDPQCGQVGAVELTLPLHSLHFTIAILLLH